MYRRRHEGVRVHINQGWDPRRGERKQRERGEKRNREQARHIIIRTGSGEKARPQQASKAESCRRRSDGGLAETRRVEKEAVVYRRVQEEYRPGAPQHRASTAI